MTDIAKLDNFIASLGAESYRVGGSVRDELIGRVPKDADYMVRGLTLVELSYKLVAAARPLGGKVTKLTLRDGRQAGYRVRLKFGEAEIVLPRKEISTGPGHRDFDLIIDKDVSVFEDAQRRDFTFNALYKLIAMPIGDSDEELAGLVTDPTGRGLYDLERRFINTTHPASFRDDPLRILRALRFVARGYSLGTEAAAQMVEHADAVNGLAASGHVSGTVFDEMEKILSGTNAVDALRIARDTGVLVVLFPELAPMLGFDQESKWHDYTVDEHTFTALAAAIRTDAPMRVRWALLFHDSGKPESSWRGDDGRLHYYSAKITELISDPHAVGGDEFQERVTEDHAVISERLWRAAANRIHAPKQLREDVATLIREHMLGLEGKFRPSKVRVARARLGDAMYADVLLHRVCDAYGKGHAPSRETQNRLLAIGQEIANCRALGVPTSVKDLKINGHDLLAIGLQSAQIGRVQKEVLHEVVSDPTAQKMSREWQLSCAARQQVELRR